MTPQQDRAIASLKTALRKLRDADLSLYVYSGNVYACPSEIDCQSGLENDAIDILEAHGADCTPAGLKADGGAGV